MPMQSVMQRVYAYFFEGEMCRYVNLVSSYHYIGYVTSYLYKAVSNSKKIVAWNRL